MKYQCAGANLDCLFSAPFYYFTYLFEISEQYNTIQYNKKVMHKKKETRVFQNNNGVY